MLSGCRTHWCVYVYATFFITQCCPARLLLASMTQNTKEFCNKIYGPSLAAVCGRPSGPASASLNGMCNRQ